MHNLTFDTLRTFVIVLFYLNKSDMTFNHKWVFSYFGTATCTLIHYVNISSTAASDLSYTLIHDIMESVKILKKITQKHDSVNKCKTFTLKKCIQANKL